MVTELNSTHLQHRVESNDHAYLNVLDIITDNDLHQMIETLSKDDKTSKIHNWTTLTTDHLKEKFASKQLMNNFFRKHELQVCLKAIKEKLQEHGITCNQNWPKYKIVQLFTSKQMINPSTRSDNTRRKNKRLLTLKALCVTKCKVLPKEYLAKELAELTWQTVLKEWYQSNPISNVGIKDIADKIEWFSQPAVDDGGRLKFHFTDACHILTCLRTKLCTTGISGLNRKAWEYAALSPDTKLNIAMIIECVDKQDVGIARRVFAEDVELKMKDIYPTEAKFCGLLRRWFDAEDEPSISSAERCKYRLDFREWLLRDYKIGRFPPPTRYVRGIPIITFEGTVSHIERKLQLYSFVPNQRYNARAIGSQDVEQFFSSFRDLEPTGKGTPKPDVIPDMMSAVIEVNNFRLNPEK